MNLRVLDTTQGTVIVPDVVQIDTAREPVNIVARNLRDVSNRGIWLNPYRGVPQANWIPALDIVYIDEDFRVLLCGQNHRQGALPEKFVSSALILPSGGVNEARIRRGDQLELCDAATGLRWAGQGADDDMSAESEIDIPAMAMAATMVEGQRRQPEASRSGLFTWLLQLKGHSTRRKAKRRTVPGLVAYFPIASTSQPSEVKNISTEGFYAQTEERWTPGTSILVSLQIINPENHAVEAMISVPSKVVWLGPDGVGFTFDDQPARWNRRIDVTNVEELVQLQRFLQRIKG